MVYSCLNFNMFLSLMLAIMLGLIPGQLGILKFIAKKENKKIADLIPYKNKISVKRLLLSTIIPLVFGICAYVLLHPLDVKLATIFNFFPEWFRLDKLNMSEISHLKLSFVLVLIFGALLGPIVEEIYFRGYLLPRMVVFGKFAPFVNTVLFAFYHLFTPWQAITRIVAVTPMVYFVWINKNIKTGIIVHCLFNICGDVIPLLFILLKS